MAGPIWTGLWVANSRFYRKYVSLYKCKYQISLITSNASADEDVDEAESAGEVQQLVYLYYLI